MRIALPAFVLSLCAVSSPVPAPAADPGITLVGQGFVPGTALDLSGLVGDICRVENASDCIPKETLGGFGSAFTYTGHDGVFLGAPDRGPFDGRTDVDYQDRVDFFHVSLDRTRAFPNVDVTLLDTRLLRDEDNRALLGATSAFDVEDPAASLRFDPEGIRVGRDGTFFVSDEYGPAVREFDRQGHLLRRFEIPAKFLIAQPSGDIDSAGNSQELYPALNTSGRQANRGMEGLAIMPDGRTLVGLMQNALIQDHGLNASVPPGRVGSNNRILTIEIATGQTREHVYTLDAINQGKGTCEILALNDHEMLVLERDNRTFVPTPPNTAAAPNLKRIYRIDLAKPGLTDVSGVASLPATGAELAGMGIIPVTKTLFLDLLDPSYRVDATRSIKDVVAEKIEALAWGPALPDGRQLLYVVSDNDLFTGLPTQIFAFAVDAAAAGVTVQPQVLPGPIFPPGQVKKALRGR